MPEIEIGNQGIVIKCTPSKSYLNLLKTSNNENGSINSSLSDPINDPISDPINYFKSLNSNENLVLGLLLKNPNITQHELADELNIALKTTKRAILSLKEKKL